MFRVESLMKGYFGGSKGLAKGLRAFEGLGLEGLQRFKGSGA